MINSGVAARIHIKDATEADFDRMIDTNYRGAYFTAQHALDHLKPQSSIIFISSCAATASFKNHSIYSSSKAAVSKLAKTIALDLADRSIRVNSISPGYVKTPIFDRVLENNLDYLQHKSKLVPLKRIGTPKTLAMLLYFLPVMKPPTLPPLIY